jgi:hypothetical protein
MYLDRNKSLSFVSALALTLACGCSSKQSGTSDQGSGGAFNIGTGGAGGASAGTVGIDFETYCNGLLKSMSSSCGQTSRQADLKTVNMLLVIDQSGSMNDKPSATATESKWSQMRKALAGALSTVAVRKNINFGLELFPYDPSGAIDPNSTDPATSCQVPVDESAIVVPIETKTDKIDAILQVVNSAAPAGGTPTARALERAYDYFTTGGGKDLPGSKWVLLATDGGPNCNLGATCGKDTCTQNMDLKCAGGDPNTTVNCCATAGFSCLDDLNVLTDIRNLATAKVGTYVIGIPGSEAYAATLNSMAIAGGVPNAGANGESYYAVSASTSLTDLQTAFEDITTKLVKTCDIELATTPTDPNSVILVKDCAIVPGVANNTPVDGGSSGFYIDYTQQPTAHLRLVGTYCDQIMTSGASQVDVIQGCPKIN